MGAPPTQRKKPGKRFSRQQKHKPPSKAKLLGTKKHAAPTLSKQDAPSVAPPTIVDKQQNDDQKQLEKQSLSRAQLGSLHHSALNSLKQKMKMIQPCTVYWTKRLASFPHSSQQTADPSLHENYNFDQTQYFQNAAQFIFEKEKYPHLQSIFGHENGKKFLSIEQVVYLSERKWIQVKSLNSPNTYTFRELYFIAMTEFGLNIDLYTIYSHLIRAGYKVQRKFPPQSSNEDQFYIVYDAWYQYMNPEKDKPVLGIISTRYSFHFPSMQTIEQITHQNKEKTIYFCMIESGMLNFMHLNPKIPEPGEEGGKIKQKELEELTPPDEIEQNDD